MSGNDRDLAARLAAATASTVADAAAGKGVVAPGLIRFSGAGAIAGRAITASCDEGALQAVFAALDQSRPGDILCVSAPGNTAYLGDLLATDIHSRGLVATVIDGNVRDRASLATMSLSVFARGTNPFAKRAQGEGKVMVPIVIGDVTISPGDWVVADDDGVIVVPERDLAGVLEIAEASVAIEERIMTRIQAGEKVRDAVRAELEVARR